SDLNWRRLKYWRRLLTQSLDPASAPGAAESVTDILVEYGPSALVRAWELVSWLARHLGWRVQGGRVHASAEMAWRFFGPQGATRCSGKAWWWPRSWLRACWRRSPPSRRRRNQGNVSCPHASFVFSPTPRRSAGRRPRSSSAAPTRRSPPATASPWPWPAAPP